MTRKKAALIHFAASILIGGAMLIWMIAVWYPGALFEAVGGEGLILILFGVDITVGPLLTFIVFDTRKVRLKYDLLAIVLLQLAAFLYGASIIFEARPVYIAFVVDRFEIVRATDIDSADLENVQGEFRSLPLFGPKRVAVELPTTIEERNKSLALALAGKDLHLVPKYYVPYRDKHNLLALAKAQSLNELQKFNQSAKKQYAELLAASGKSEAELKYLPVRARSKDLSAIINSNTGEIIDFWPLNPWKS